MCIVLSNLSESFSGFVSLVDCLFIPELVLQELLKLAFNLYHDVQLFFLEFKGRVQLLRIIWEGDSIFKVNVVEPFLQVVLEETE